MTFRRHKWMLVCLAIASLVAGCATPEESSEGDEAHVTLPPESIAWADGPASLPPGARAAVLAGDPAADGPFVMRIEVPAGFTIPPHTHARTEHVTILNGTAHLGKGPDMSAGERAELPAGSYFQVPPRMVHFFQAGDEPVVLQLHGEGPWGITYVDPADDPRNDAGRAS